MWVGTVTMAVGVMYAMVQTDLKRMLAFSTVSQIGYMMMGIGIGTPLAITAGLLHCLNHGFFKGGLFLTAGSVQHAAGTRDMNKLGGLATKMPRRLCRGWSAYMRRWVFIVICVLLPMVVRANPVYCQSSSLIALALLPLRH